MVLPDSNICPETLDFKNDGPRLPSLYVLRKVQRGIYMGGSIKADSREVCSCGKSFTQIKEFNYSIPKCLSCNTYPTKLLIRRYLPSLDGRRGERIEIRYNQLGERLTTVWDAVATMKLIDKELNEGSFDPKRYMSEAVSDQLRLRYFLENKYLPNQERRVKRGELSPEMYKKKKTYFKHLSPLYQYDVRTIGTGRVFEFYESWTDRLRTRDLVIQELKCIFTYALNLELINSLPNFPKLKPSKKRSANSFLTDSEQKLILENIVNPTYKKMISLLCLYALRPSEVRALKWKDFDFKEKIISINRHFSNGTTLVEGRKSNKETHYLPMTDAFFKIIEDLPISLIKENFVFLGRTGGEVGDRVLARAWHTARKKAGLPYIQLYEGTKHSRLSLLKAKGHSDEELILLSGHTNIKTVQRYAQLNDSQKLNQVRSLLEKV